MKNFKDNFSKQSKIYSKYRPTYPIELFEYLSSLTEEHELAWDCGTGNGQAAFSLTNFYKKVFATDPSKEQINNAQHHPKIIYKVEKAEESRLEENSIDLITSANAVHWFNFGEFYKKAKLVLKPNGIIAVWTYTSSHISKEIDEIVKDFHDNVVGEFWQNENKMVSNEYSTIPFPFRQLSSPLFKIQKKLSLEDLLGYVNSWSALQRFIDKKGYNPLGKLEDELTKFWKNKEEKKESTREIILKVGKNTKWWTNIFVHYNDITKTLRAKDKMTAKQFIEKLSRFKSDRELNKVEIFFKGNDRKTKALGVKFGDIFKIAKEFTEMPLKEIEKLLESNYYEVRMGGVSIMDYQAKNKKTTDIRKKELFELYLNRHERINNWDLVDRGAPSIIGGYLIDKPRCILYKLANSKDVWERRTAIVSTYAFIKKSEVKDTFQIAEILINDKHELINKAVGGWIREAGKKDEEKLKSFLDKHASSMPRITLSYAIEKFDKPTKKHYLNFGKKKSEL